MQFYLLDFRSKRCTLWKSLEFFHLMLFPFTRRSKHWKNIWYIGFVESGEMGMRVKKLVSIQKELSFLSASELSLHTIRSWRFHSTFLRRCIGICSANAAAKDITTEQNSRILVWLLKLYSKHAEIQHIQQSTTLPCCSTAEKQKQTNKHEKWRRKTSNAFDFHVTN